jgi:hypothetical protein
MADDLDLSPAFFALSCFSHAFTIADETFELKSTVVVESELSAHMELGEAKTSTPFDAAETVYERSLVKHSMLSTLQFSSRSLKRFTRAPATVIFLSEFFRQLYR